MSSINCFDLSPQVYTQQSSDPFWLQFLLSDGEDVIHSPACFSIKTTSWPGAIRAKSVCVVKACTRVMYSRAGFGQRLLACLTNERTCTNSFCPKWSRLPYGGSLCRYFVTPQVTTGQKSALQTLCRFRYFCPKERLKECSSWKNQLSTRMLTNF